MFLLTYIPLKRCYKCELYKKYNEFSKNTARYDKLMTACKKCKNKIRLERADKHKAIARELRKQGCIYCGESDVTLLDFHHINPAMKYDKVSNLYRATSIKFKEELNKCELVCAGCHRKLENGYKLCKMHDIIQIISCISRTY